jgi:methylphosphotriester-DNA--protein-cysteine methyltransferase
MRDAALATRIDVNETFLTLEEVAERLKVNGNTVRRLFANEPGVPAERDAGLPNASRSGKRISESRDTTSESRVRKRHPTGHATCLEV